MDFTTHPRCKTCKHWSQGVNGPDDGACGQADFPGYGGTLAPGTMSADENNHGVITHAEFYCPNHSELPKSD